MWEAVTSSATAPVTDGSDITLTKTKIFVLFLMIILSVCFS